MTKSDSAGDAGVNWGLPSLGVSRDQRSSCRNQWSLIDYSLEVTS
jgi:hypothetical protein